MDEGEFYQMWRAWTDEYCMSDMYVLVWTIEAIFDIRRAGVMRIWPVSRKGDVPTYRPATRSELDELRWSILYNFAQIEARARYPVNDPRFRREVLYQATGRRRNAA